MLQISAQLQSHLSGRFKKLTIGRKTLSLSLSLVQFQRLSLSSYIGMMIMED